MYKSINGKKKKKKKKRKTIKLKTLKSSLKRILVGYY